MDVESLIDEFRRLVHPTPALQHPWFQGIITGQFSVEQIIAGERQHYLRNHLNAVAQAAILAQATIEGDDELIAAAVENMREEVCGRKTHGDLMYQFLEVHGISKAEARATSPMPGTRVALETIIYGLETLPTTVERIAVWSLAEWENGGEDGVAAAVYRAYTEQYGFSHYAAETYQVHAVADVGHGDTQLTLLARKVLERPELKNRVIAALNYGHRGFNAEWDGHYQAAVGNPDFCWRGAP